WAYDVATNAMGSLVLSQTMNGSDATYGEDLAKTVATIRHFATVAERDPKLGSSKFLLGFAEALEQSYEVGEYDGRREPPNK
ncbi:MAG: hypothetical protein WKG03_03675, partial [Telluria sp.]